jgi:putative endonuclease
MAKERMFYVYMLASRSRVLYIGMTNDLARRVEQHKTKSMNGFTSKYNVNRLVYFETTNDPRDAIAREKQLKGWRRERKIALIEQANPAWKDLSETWTAEPDM